MQDIVYKLVPGLQEGKCHVLSVFMMQPPRDPTDGCRSLSFIDLLIFCLQAQNVPEKEDQVKVSDK